MRVPKIDMSIGIMVGSVIVIFLALFYFGDDIGLPTTADTDFLSILPGLFCFAVGILIIGRMGGLFALPGLSVVGIGIAILSEQMYDLGILNDQMISYLTIGEFQMLVIAVSFLVGAVVSGVTARR